MNDKLDNSNITSSIVFQFCFLTLALAEYGKGLEWPIIGAVSVTLNLYSYTLHFPSLVGKNSLNLNQFFLWCSSKLLLLLLFSISSLQIFVAGPLNQLLLFRTDLVAA